jgi:NADH-quinone oxidoreductase subunit F
VRQSEDDMPILTSADELRRWVESAKQQQRGRGQGETIITIGMGTCGIAAGAREVHDAFEKELRRRKISATLRATGCLGVCAKEPLVDVQLPGQARVLYANVTPELAPALVEQHILGGRPLRNLMLGSLPADDESLARVEPQISDLPLFSKQLRIAMRNCGIIDPESLEEYLARDGYLGLARAIADMTPQAVIAEVKAAGLRGRGGAGFLTGLKWELCRNSVGGPKYVICNADEGDPGAFMDRSVLESDPHSVIEGMAIAAFAIGASQGFIYCREEYPMAISRLQTAICQARDCGLLGSNVLGSGFAFDISLKEGAGAFVCGEETALIASIEGKRGEPRPRPPFPVQSGLWGKPTSINNVKSYAMTPQIITHGAAWFNSIGIAKSPGTAVFALTGKINQTGLIEVPMGIPLGDIIFDIGGGIPRGKQFKAVQTGGPLGGCLPAAYLNTPVDFDSLQEAGAVMGSGGMIVVDDDTCMVELAKYFLQFAAAESCGKCVPCRVGGQRLLEILERISNGEGKRADLERIREISSQMMGNSLCGLGQRTPGPVMAALRFFEEEFITHIDDKLCKAGQCRALVRARCVNSCPAGVDTPAYLSLVAQGQFAAGLEIHRERNPFASVCGRACPAFCESKCRRGEVDEPVAVRLIKRFMADSEFDKPWTPPLVVSEEAAREASRRHVAVVGSGPAGLTAALRLAQRGYRVTVYEKLSFPGGMLSWAIPEYRLPRKVLFAEIDNIRRAGVEIRCEQALGRDFTLDELLGERGHAAVILAIGAHHSRKLNIPGEAKSGVIDGIEFLYRVAADTSLRALGQQPPGDVPDVKGKRLAVIGGGDVAIDVARTGLRLGAREVHVIYRRAGDDMPAAHLPEEIAAARDEGIRFHTLANPIEVLGDDAVTGLRLQQQRLDEFDDSARRKPVPLAAESYVLNCEVVIPAIGQTPEVSCLPAGALSLRRGDTFAVGEALETSRAGVFAAGDAVSGPATIVEAVAQGNLVAVAVDQWLRTGEVAKPQFVTARHDEPEAVKMEEYVEVRRQQSAKLPLQERDGCFKEVELGLAEAAARREAGRCLRCDLEWLDLMKLPRPGECGRGDAKCAPEAAGKEVADHA